MSNCIEKVLGGLVGLTVGDAFGVPFESMAREEVEEALALLGADEMPGYGSHRQPPGTWSDDSSLTLATIDTLARRLQPQTARKKVPRLVPRWEIHAPRHSIRRRRNNAQSPRENIRRSAAAESRAQRRIRQRLTPEDLPVAIYCSGIPTLPHSMRNILPHSRQHPQRLQQARSHQESSGRSLSLLRGKMEGRTETLSENNQRSNRGSRRAADQKHGLRRRHIRSKPLGIPHLQKLQRNHTKSRGTGRRHGYHSRSRRRTSGNTLRLQLHT